LNVAKVAPKYVRQSITATGGGAGDRPMPGWSAIAPVVGALPSLVRALSIDIAPLRVNVVVPGAVKTEMWDVRVFARDEIETI
jgi:NAD(P)-dependent dehydrogenase (short-subunit alcohol dehydrogenase family)